MKTTIFLVMYLFHFTNWGFSSVGGPALTITQMPSKEVCEKVGAMVQSKMYKQETDNKLTYYWCIEVQ